MTVVSAPIYVLGYLLTLTPDRAFFTRASDTGLRSSIRLNTANLRHEFKLTNSNKVRKKESPYVELKTKVSQLGHFR